MSANLRLADNLNPPASEAVTQTFVVYGGRGAGKTNFGRVMAEEFSRTRQRFVAMDPLGVWWGLKHSADGKGPGIDVLLLGGRRGDIPIVPTAGAVVADLVVDSDVDVVVDFSRHPDGRLWSKGEKIRFATDFSKQFYQRQGERMRPTNLLWDEIARFVPQTLPKGAVAIAECMGAVEDVVEEGRNVGIGIGMITQRSARLNKSVSELAECMVAFRTVGPRSIDAILDWFGDNVPKERWNGLVDTIRHLKVGQALVVSPGWLNFEGVVNVRLAHTFDSSATPKAEGRGVPRKLERADLDVYERRMAATIEAVRENDPKALRMRVVELERALKSAGSKAAPVRVEATAQQVVEVPVPVATPEETEEYRRMAETVPKRIVAALQEAADDASGLLADLLAAGTPMLRQPTARERPMMTVHGHAGVPLRHIEERDGDFGDAPSLLLRALARFESLGLREVRKGYVAALAGRSPTSSTTTKAFRALRDDGLVEYPSDGLVAMTPAGRERAPDPGRHALEPADLIGAWRESVLDEYDRALFDVLVGSFPKAVARAELAARSGKSATSSTFVKSLRKMRDFGIVEYGGVGVRASERLFLQATAGAAR